MCFRLQRVPSYAVGSFCSLPHTLHKLAAFWWIKGPAEGMFLSHCCAHGVGPASESLTWRVYKASTGACSPIPYHTPLHTCFALVLCWFMVVQLEPPAVRRGSSFTLRSCICFLEVAQVTLIYHCCFSLLWKTCTVPGGRKIVYGR